MEYKNYSLEECADAMGEYMRKHPDASFHQKFSCEHCGSRQTMSEANKFFTSGTCEECGHSTDLKTAGCNYLIIRRAI